MDDGDAVGAYFRGDREIPPTQPLADRLQTTFGVSTLFDPHGAAFRPIFWSLLAILAAAPGGAQGDDAALRARVKTEYPAALERLRRQYSQVHGSFKSSVHKIPKAGNEPSSASRVEFFFDGEFQKTISVRELGDGPYSTIVCLAPTVHFRVEQDAKGASPALRRFGAGQNAVMARAMEQYRLSTVAAPYSVGFPIIDLLNQPGFAFDRVAEVERDRRKLVELSYTRHLGPKNGGVDEKCRLIVSPDEGWALREYEAKTPTSVSSLQVEYQPSKGGIPALRGLVRTEPTRRQIVEFESFEFGPTPPEEFTLPASGFPAIDADKPPRSPNRPAVWLVVAGALTAILAAILAFVQRRRS